MEKDITAQETQVSIRPYRDSDQQSVVDLWETVFGKTLPVPLWRWKYVENPFGYRILLCIDDAGKILALYGGIPYSANCGGRTVEIIQLMDIMSHPEYRGRGYFARAAQAFFDTYGGSEKSPLLYGFPGRQHYDIGEKYLHYTALKGGAAYLTVDMNRLQPTAPPGGGTAMQVRSIDGVFDRLWQHCRAHYPMAVIRDRRFLQWRFLSHPRREYDIWGYYERNTGELTAYAVFQCKADKCVLVDWLSLPEKELVHGFLSGLKGFFQSKGVEQLVTWLPSGHFLNDMFIAAGFSTEPEPIGFIPTARSFDPALTMDWVSDHIYYSMGDADLF